ncbi:putative transmembrane protein [Spiroplasma kunkelii CR2-3x]|uniref:Putative transmembrane protein n=1 Tax=Spiroplasma kunkelii CR2-3x TaxID=273035 RepID=A0A0K2JFG5_SPIKU|nr:hypothetical protein [Spiroplasma kunkelii]ALA97315.1 putative transmembrane protein [Spiroplasma kunkelii CR2-3x]
MIKMRTDFKKYFQVFFNIYFILFSLYFGISLFLPCFVPHFTNWAFVSILLNLTYIVLITGAFFFLLAVLIQILSDFKHYKRIILQWYNILKVNVIVILLWLANIFWLSYTIYWNITITWLLSFFTQFYFQLYQSILISFYFFYALFIITFFISLVILLRIYLIYWYKINDLIYFNPFFNLTLFLNILESYLFMRYRINILVIFLLKKIIIISFIIANIIKTYRLILFKKETTPPQQGSIITKILTK